MGADVYKLRFVWSESDGRLKVVYCDEQDVPHDGGLAGFFVDDYFFQWKNDEISSNYQILGDYAASVAANKKHLVQIPRGRFLYMDVGCWLDGKQTFGMVCGADAVLCAFDPKGSGGSGTRTTSGLINQVLGIPGVSVKGWQKILGPHPKDPQRLIVILPDMHVPDAPPLGMKRPEGYPDNQFGNWREDPKAFDELAKDDFFNSRKSIPAMVKFLQALRERVASSVTLVQLGDMYELWAGHELEYQQTDGGHPEVRLKDDTSARSVGGWIRTIHDAHDYLFEQFDRCNAEMLMIFLHGNHDSYLSRPEVIAAANREIEEFCSYTNEIGYVVQAFKKTSVYPRIRSINYDGVFIEHGQRVDKANRDGEVTGWTKTNEAFDSPGRILKMVGDTTRRRSFVTGAAAHWVVNEKSYGLYVMGHTHDPELKYVEVVHQRGTISFSGGKVKITSTGDL